MRYLVYLFVLFAFMLCSCSDEEILYSPIIESQLGWEQLDGPFGGHVISMIAGSSGKIFLASNDDLYISSDNGDNWKEIFQADDGIISICKTPSGELYVFTYSGYYYSNDGGNTWIQKNLRSNISIAHALITPLGKIAVHSLNAIYTSTNNGNSWHELAISGSNGITDMACNSKGEIFLFSQTKGIFTLNDREDSLKIIKNTGNFTFIYNQYFSQNDRLYIVSDNGKMKYSEDNLLTWQDIEIPSGIQYIYSILENSNGGLFIGTNNGIYFSSDNGKKWNAYLGDILPERFFQCNNILFISSVKNSLYRSLNNGYSWEKKNTGIKNAEILTLTVDSKNNLYTTGYGNVLQFSSNNGITWKNIELPYSNPPVNELLADKKGNIYALLSNFGVLFSSDNGRNWKNILLSSAAMTMALNSKDELYVITYNNKIYYTANQGDKWKNIDGPDIDFGDILINKNDDLIVTKRFYGIDYSSSLSDGSGRSPIFISSNNGGSWQQVDIHKDYNYCSGVVASRQGSILTSTENGIFRSRKIRGGWKTEKLANAPKFINLYTNSNMIIGISNHAHSGEVFYSPDDGDTWEKSIIPLGNKSIYSIFTTPDNTIYIGTSGSGIWKIKK